MSTRLFLLDRGRFRSAIGALAPTPPPSLRSRIKAFVEGNPSADLPEHLFTREMRRRRMVRRDFLGTAPGMWSLHPPYRCADFYGKLPDLISRIETGNVPEAQRGDHDINGSLVDWTEALDRLARESVVAPPPYSLVLPNPRRSLSQTPADHRARFSV